MVVHICTDPVKQLALEHAEYDVAAVVAHKFVVAVALAVGIVVAARRLAELAVHKFVVVVALVAGTVVGTVVVVVVVVGTVVVVDIVAGI